MINIATGKRFDDSYVPRYTQYRLSGPSAGRNGSFGTVGNSSSMRAADVGVAREMIRGIGARNAAICGGKALPYDAEVEYIESTGTQIVNLWFGFDNTDVIDAVFSIDITQTEDKYINSPIQWNDLEKNRFSIGVHKRYFTCAYGSFNTQGTHLLPNTYSDGLIHTWMYADRVFSIPELNISINCSTIDFNGTTKNLRLFYGYNSNTKGKIHQYTHKKLNGDGCDFVSVRVGQVGYLYDRMHPTGGPLGNGLYGNDGTGDFVIGPDIP